MEPSVSKERSNDSGSMAAPMETVILLSRRLWSRIAWTGLLSAVGESHPSGMSPTPGRSARDGSGLALHPEGSGQATMEKLTERIEIAKVETEA